MKPWYRLNLNIDNAIKDRFVFPQIKNPMKICIYDAEQIFSGEWLSYMKDQNLIVNRAYVFIRKDYQKDNSAHIDSTDDGTPNPISLNWVQGIDDRDMVWYHTEGVELEYKLTPAGTRYYDVPISKLTEIDRCRIGNQITLVKTDTLHSLVDGQQPRCCITARLSLDPGTTWNQFVEQHQHLIKK